MEMEKSLEWQISYADVYTVAHREGGVQTPPPTGLQIERKMFSVPIPTT